MLRGSRAAPEPKYADSVFVNFPFDSEYQPIFHAIVFALHDCGYVARCALEADDSGDARIGFESFKEGRASQRKLASLSFHQSTLDLDRRGCAGWG